MYDAMLSVPGMSDTVKVGFTMSRRDILFLSRIIEAGLNTGTGDSESMISLISKESRDGFQAVIEEILKRAELTDFNEKLKQL